MVEREYLCLWPFVAVHLKCDLCGEWSKGRGHWLHVVELRDGRTICLPCFWQAAIHAEERI